MVFVTFAGFWLPRKRSRRLMARPRSLYDPPLVGRVMVGRVASCVALYAEKGEGTTGKPLVWKGGRR